MTKLDVDRMARIVTVWASGLHVVHGYCVDGVPVAEHSREVVQGTDSTSEKTAWRASRSWEQTPKGESCWAVEGFTGDPHVALVNACGRARMTRGVHLVQCIESMAPRNLSAAIFLLERARARRIRAPGDRARSGRIGDELRGSQGPDSRESGRGLALPWASTPDTGDFVKLP